MDLPPSGWYPDPYGTPALLRWWDGSTWTQHTHPDVTAVGAGTGTAGGEAATAVQATTVQPAALQATALQATAVQATALQATTVQPSADRLSRTKPPTGRPTQPQAALPATPYQPAATTVQPGTVQATAFQPVTVQPGYPQPSAFQPMPGQGGGIDRAGTQVLYPGGGDWQMPAGPAGPGGPGGPGNRYGYQDAQRRRRRRLVIGITAGTVAAVAAIAIIVSNLHSPASTAADQTPITPATTPVAAPSPTASASVSASPTATASPSVTATGSLLTDGQAGLSYSQLPSPWQGPSCAPSLDNGAFTWTAGEYATAGQIDGGSMTWYGEACSGPLPASYGYTGSTQLQTITENLAQTFENAYYDDLDHNINQEEDQATTVSGHSAWEVSYDVVYTNSAQESTWSDEQATVVVVDNGTDQPAVFFTSIPQNLNEDNGIALIQSLQLTSATAAPSDSATASDDQGASQSGD